MVIDRATRLWPAVVVATCALLPFAVDPWGLRPFLPPKSMLLLVGAAFAALLASLAGLSHCLPLPRQADSPAAAGDGMSPASTATAIDRWIVVAALATSGWAVLAPLPFAANRTLHLLSAAELMAAATLGALTVLAIKIDRRWRDRLMGTLAITAVLMAVHALLQAAGLDPLEFFIGIQPQAEGRWRTFTTAGNPNWTAAYLACSAPLVAWMARRRGSVLLEAAVWGLFATAVLLTGSRLALIALAAGGICWWRSTAPALRKPTRGSRWGKLLAVITALILFGSALLVFGGELGQRWGDLRSVGGRIISFGVALHLISMSPLAGHGLGHFQLGLPEGLRQLHAQVGDAWLEWWPRSLTAHVHNDFLEMGVGAGVVGMLLLGLLWGLAFYCGRRREPAPSAALLSLAILALASVPLQIPTTMLLFCILVGLAAAGPAVPAAQRSTTPSSEVTEEPLRENERDSVIGPASRARSSSARPYSAAASTFVLRAMLVLLALGATAGSLACGISVLSANRMAKHSRQLLSARDLEGTQATIHEVLVATPWDHESGAILAAIQVDEGRPTDALEVLDSIDRWSASRGSWIVRAQALRALDMEPQAIAVLEAAVQALPDFLRAHFLLGELYASLGMSEESRAALKRVIDSRQDSSSARVFKDMAERALERRLIEHSENRN